MGRPIPAFERTRATDEGGVVGPHEPLRVRERLGDKLRGGTIHRKGRGGLEPLEGCAEAAGARVVGRLHRDSGPPSRAGARFWDPEPGRERRRGNVGLEAGSEAVRRSAAAQGGGGAESAGFPRPTLVRLPRSHARLASPVPRSVDPEADPTMSGSSSSSSGDDKLTDKLLEEEKPAEKAGITDRKLVIAFVAMCTIGLGNRIFYVLQVRNTGFTPARIPDTRDGARRGRGSSAARAGADGWCGRRARTPSRGRARRLSLAVPSAGPGHRVPRWIGHGRRSEEGRLRPGRGRGPSSSSRTPRASPAALPRPARSTAVHRAPPPFAFRVVHGERIRSDLLSVHPLSRAGAQFEPMQNYPVWVNLVTTFVYIPASFAYIIPMIRYGSAVR